MTDSDTELRPEHRPSRTELLFNLISERWWSIILTVSLLCGGALVLSIEIPRRLLIVLVALAPGLVVGHFSVNQLIAMLPDPPSVWLVEVDATEQDASVWQIPKGTFREFDTTDGVLDNPAPGLYFGKNVDKDARTVEGTWRGTLPDRELLVATQKIRECREQLEDDAKKGFAIETTAFTIVRRATRSATLSVIQTFENGTLPDEGSGINDAIDDALAQFDFDRQLDDLDDHDPDADVAESLDDQEELDDVPEVEQDDEMNEVPADD